MRPTWINVADEMDFLWSWGDILSFCVRFRLRPPDPTMEADVDIDTKNFMTMDIVLLVVTKRF